MGIRTYRSGDRDGCLGVFDSNVPEDFRLQERGEFSEFLGALPGPYWVVEEDGVVIGCGGVAIEPDGVTATLCWGMVRRDRQGEGLGQRLGELRLEWARGKKGLRRVAAHTSQRTQGFFERLGFRPIHVAPDGIAPGLDAVAMVLDLPPH